jgi:hypothetical protein
VNCGSSERKKTIIFGLPRLLNNPAGRRRSG